MHADENQEFGFPGRERGEMKRGRWDRSQALLSARAGSAVKRLGAVLVVIIGIGGCEGVGNHGCPEQEIMTAEFVLPVRLPTVDDWYWELDRGLPLPVQDPLLPWPGVWLNSVTIFRDRGDYVVLEESHEDGMVVLSYGTREAGTGQSQEERRWLEEFASQTMDVIPEELAPILDEYGEIHQAGGPPQFHRATFSADLLDLHKYWNLTQPTFSEIGNSSGFGGDCIWGICYRGEGTMWSFSWAHSSDLSEAGTIRQSTLAEGLATSLDGPAVFMTPWGTGQVMMPGNDTAAVQRYAEEWIARKGLPAASSIKTQVWNCPRSSQWPATTNPEDLNADAPYMAN